MAEPVDKVIAKILVALIPQVGIGNKIAVTEDDDALTAFFYLGFIFGNICV